MNFSAKIFLNMYIIFVAVFYFKVFFVRMQLNLFAIIRKLNRKLLCVFALIKNKCKLSNRKKMLAEYWKWSRSRQRKHQTYATQMMSRQQSSQHISVVILNGFWIENTCRVVEICYKKLADNLHINFNELIEWRK